VAGKLQDCGATIELKVDVGDARANVERVGKEADVVILCTHGRSGFDRLRHGSVAEHVMQTIDRPALLVRAGAHKA
jgi:nucleotide-binding universal stress UspA family protein